MAPLATISSRELLSKACSSSSSSVYTPFPTSFPSHKRIPGTRFVVDAFGSAATGPWCTAYFLSHFHSDHYAGIVSSWDKGIIFCSSITARLVSLCLNVHPAFVVELPYETVVRIDGCKVALVDANHCPGAVQMLFEVESEGGTQRFVHTGDMRFTPEMKTNVLLCDFIGADAVFLDTTYCHPKFTFPCQEESISYVANTISAELTASSSSLSTLFLIATYVVGKEKLLSAVVSKCGCKVYVSERKVQVLRCLGLEESLLAALVTDPTKASVHVVQWDLLGDAWPYFRPNFDDAERVRKEAGYDRVVGFFPTGWTWSSGSFSVRRKGQVDIHLVPYSEHSSYQELREYVGFLRPKEIIPTVGLDDKGLEGKTVANIREHFRNLVDETASKRKFLRGFKRKAPDTTQQDGKAIFKMRLSDVLPSWVNDAQMDRLHEQALGDFSTAVSLFFDQQKELEAESKGESPSKSEGIESQQECSPLPVSEEKCSAASPLKLVRQPVGSSASPKKLVNRSTKPSKKKGGSAAQNKNQLSILSFFQKQASTVAPSAQQQEKLEQLQAVLGQEVPQAAALDLLERAGGDITAAVNLAYDTPPGRSVLIADEASPALKVERPEPSRNLEPDVASFVVPLSLYHPKDTACWSAGEPAPYLHLARTFDLVEKEKGRNRSTEMLCNMFWSLLVLSPDDVLPAMYLTTNRLAPDHVNVDLNVGFSSVIAAIEEVTGTPRSKLKDLYNKKGDLGDVAQVCRQNQVMLVQPRPLSIRHVFDTLKQISEEAGTGSAGRKKNLMISLLRSCREKEVTYLVRTLVRNMRIGATDKTVLPALARAVVLQRHGPKAELLKEKLQEASEGIIRAYSLLPDFDRLVPSLLQGGLPSVTVPSPGVPIKPMLAKIAKESRQVLKQFEGAFTCEFKYDGCRAQIHQADDGSIYIFSRNCENATARFPDVVETVKAAVRPGTRSFIIDAEVVAVDRAVNNKLLAFQTLSTRERGQRRGTTSISSSNIKVDVCVFVFDIMYLDGEPLVDRSLRLRRERMHDIFPTLRPGYLEFATEITVDCKEANLSAVENFLNAAIAASCEGLMAKAMDKGSEYSSGRGDAWLKIKRDYVDGLSDTLDLVPIGAWHGNGRKAGWYSPFLVACYDPDKEEFQSVCRVMSGFSDAFYEQITAFFVEERVLSKKPSYYQTLDNPDVWLSAELVWEIRAADLTLSPTHRAAIGLAHPERGISMRFPRFTRERPDKKAEDASPASEVAGLFEAQMRKALS